MAKMTPKQQSFVTHKAAGCTNRDAAVAAGYAVGGAAQAGDRLMKHPAIRKALKDVAPTSGVAIQPPAMPKDHYADPMSFLVDVMNHQQLPIAVRADAAKQLLPYQHARMGEVGKKQTAKDRAAEIASGNGGRFSPKRSPSLHVVR
ncbi:terminase small subunit [Luteimonas sp. MC1782]|uniref:terminase small subunit n=1 Tax=Luteimonas sp. MC1782 TaxID=2760305 RepID=UPI001603AF9C|nr:terminase small subunit [Luteimonas sp. MC1782]MBB1471826.1 terminase small subunit [Luteimonas sp. MC1782]